MKTYWLSFANPQFLGVVITEARDLASALRKTYRAGINPGGSVKAHDITEYATAICEAHKNKLLSKSEASKIKLHKH